MLLDRMGHALEKPWNEAKQRLGAAEAGTTLRAFLIKNMKVRLFTNNRISEPTYGEWQPSDISPWVEVETDTDTSAGSSSVHVLGQHGSSNPLTFDTLVCMCNYVPTMRPATLTLMDVGECVEVIDNL
ncbi:hypothetical protein SCP_0406160 [Sparassis crispa]|uniref:Uncharacterized protein n=1 Tax=Sparassis crispa TaxID=139825 RepID=A0A401GJ95_9APHY|nr:hypothetical protein SCP_0406160 [Sparassis crispa]GBE82233.1 hypothetical protein SCP_0406160 [Sparassis crispa]